MRINPSSLFDVALLDSADQVGPITRKIESSEVGSPGRTCRCLEHRRKIAKILKDAKNSRWVHRWIRKDLLHRIHEAINRSRVTACSGAPSQRVTKAVRIGHASVGIGTKREEFGNHHE